MTELSQHVLSVKDPSVIYVAARGHIHLVATSIKNRVRDTGSCTIQAIGLGAIEVATKAMIKAVEYLAVEGINIYFQPSFVKTEVDGKEMTAMRWAGKVVTE